jgi:uncharacterized membrane protein YphA (DoxX/SURF4 family)
VALTLPALILRLTLCLIFAWAGLGKILGETTVTGDAAARLARMGVLTPAAGDPATQPSTQPSTQPPTQPRPAPPRDLPEPDAPGAPSAAEPETGPSNPPAEPPTELVVPDEPAPVPVSSAVPFLGEPVWLPVRQTRPAFNAADFPGEYTVQRVCGVALVLSRAADPGLTDDSRPIPATMPAWVGADRWPVILAWAAAVCELLAAAMLLFGVLTRLAAVIVVVVMLQAMWLTQIGPAVMGSGATYLGFIPAGGEPWAPGTYQTLFFQLTNLVMAVAVFLLGSGPVGFDRALFRSPERLERSEAPARRRSTFDRQATDTP